MKQDENNHFGNEVAFTCVKSGQLLGYHQVYSEQHSQISETITQLSMTWYSQYSQIKSMEVKDWRLDYLPQKIFQNQDEKLKNWFCSWRKVKARPWFQCKVY